MNLVTPLTVKNIQQFKLCVVPPSVDLSVFLHVFLAWYFFILYSVQFNLSIVLLASKQYTWSFLPFPVYAKPLAKLRRIHLPGHSHNPSINIRYWRFDSYQHGDQIFSEKIIKREESERLCTTETSDGGHRLLDLPDAPHAPALHVDLEPETPGSLLRRAKASLSFLIRTARSHGLDGSGKKNKLSFPHRLHGWFQSFAWVILFAGGDSIWRSWAI